MMSSGLVHYLLRHWGILPSVIGQFHQQQKETTLQVATMSNPMILAGLKTGEIDIGIGRMSDPELMTGLNYELLFLESLKLVVRLITRYFRRT